MVEFFCIYLEYLEKDKIREEERENGKKDIKENEMIRGIVFLIMLVVKIITGRYRLVQGLCSFAPSEEEI